MAKNIIEKVSKNVLRIKLQGIKSQDVTPLFFCSDIHIDNPKCNKKLFIDDMKRAQDRGAFIFIIGDLLDLMQGKKDRRSDKGALRKEFLSDRYINNVIEYSFKELLPFKDNIAMISDGNHETAVKNHLEVDVLGMLCKDLQEVGSPVCHMPYQGWIILNIDARYKDTSQKAIKIFYSHGNWHGVISMGTQAIRRYAAVAADADIFVSGDNHERWTAGHAVFKIGRDFEQIVVNQIHIKTGTYKEEFATGSGWAVEKIGLPKVLGGTYLDIRTTISRGIYNCDFEVKNRF